MFVCIFESIKTPEKTTMSPGYDEMAEAMIHLAMEQPGFIRVDSVRDEAGKGITVSCWESLAAIDAWKAVLQHRVAQQLGQEKWYQSYRVTVAQAVRDYSWGNAAEGFVPRAT